LIYLQKNLKMVYLRELKSGGNADIWKCCIEGDFAIPKHWKFCWKIQKGETDSMPRLWPCNLCMTAASSGLQFIHPNMKDTHFGGMGEPLERC
jgi:hypothetical protein